MNISLKNLPAVINKLKTFFKQYATFIFILIGLGIFGFLVFRIRTLAGSEPDSSLVDEKTGQAGSISIDKSAVEKIQQLQDTNVQVKALFDQARDNPFQE